MAQEFSLEQLTKMGGKPVKAPATDAPAQEFSLAELQKMGPIKSVPMGELPFSNRFGLSFASNLEERRGYLDRQYPGVEFFDNDENLVKLPGENTPRYIDSPEANFTDVFDFGGDVPVIAGGLLGSVVGGAVGGPAAPLTGAAGLAVGAGAGEGVRKLLGHQIIGVPDKQTSQEKGEDIAMTGLLAPLLEMGSTSAIGGMKAVGSQAGGAVKKGLAKLGGLLKPVSDKVDDYLPGLKGGAKGTFDEMEQTMKNSTLNLPTELPQAAEVKMAESVLPDLHHKVSPIQKSMYSDKQTQTMVGALRQTPSKEGQALVRYEQAQKAELTSKLKTELEKLNGGKPPRLTPEETGQAVTEAANAIYNAEKKALKPVFDQIDGAPVRAAKSHLASLRMRIGNSFNYLKGVSFGPGGVVLPKYSAELGISRPNYALLSDAVSALNKPNLDVKGLRGIRETLRQSLDMNSQGAEVINQFRKGVLDHIVDIVEEVSPNVNVSQSMRRWAVNESNRDTFEKIVGGSLDSFGSKKAIPEKIISRMFNNTTAVKLAKEIFGPEQLNGFLSDYVAQSMSKFTDKGVFSPQQFSKWIKTQGPAVREAFVDNPQSLQRITGISDLMRLIPDAPPANPSGTAPVKTWIDILMSPQESAKDAAKGLIQSRSAKKQGKKLARDIEARASGRPPRTSKQRTSGLATASKAKGLIRDEIDKANKDTDE
jgi:hypothetical protein